MNRKPDQQRSLAKRMASAVACLSLVASMATLPACAPSNIQEGEDVQSTPAEYLVSLNSYATDLSAKLTDFSDAATQGKLAMLSSKAQAAAEVMDKMTSLEAPDAMGDVKDGYDSAIGDLKAALDGYLALYNEISDAAKSGTYSASDYDSRLEELQKQYDQGLNELEEADKKAAEL